MRPFVSTIALVCAVALGACEGDAVEDTAAPSASSPTATVDESPTATASPAPTASSSDVARVTTQSVDANLPRSTVYGGMTATVTAITFGNATPGSYLDEEPEAGDQTYAFVDLGLAWEDGYPGGFGQVDAAWFSLMLAGGTAVPATEVDFQGAFFVEDGQPAEATVAFAVDDPGEVARASLRIQETGHVPAFVPLAGAPPDDAFPLALDVEGEASVSVEGGCGDGESTVTLVGGEADVDAGVDHDGERILNSGTARAASDHVFVRLTFRTLVQSGTCGGAIVNDDQYRLSVDGLPAGPLNRTVVGLDPGEGVELTFGWQVPVDAELEVTVGTVAGTTAVFPVLLPPIVLPG